MHYACFDGNQQLALSLIRAGADLYGPDDAHKLPLDNYGYYYDDTDTHPRTEEDKEEQMSHLVQAYRRESNWRRRKHFAIFLKSLDMKTKQSTRMRSNLAEAVFCTRDIAHYICNFI